MKKLFIGVSVVLALGLILAACSNVVSPDALGMARKAAVSSIVWLGQPDIDAAVEVIPTASDRKNASGPKITSNAHSADFAGVYFRWEQKQKDSGYLKVEPEVFEKYGGFILTKKVSNTYWDYEIKLQSEDQPTSDDGCYVFAIPDGKVYVGDGFTLDGIPKKKLVDNKAASGNFNINMVFIPEFKVKDKPVSDIYDTFPPAKKYEIKFLKEVYDADGKQISLAEWIADKDLFKFDLFDGDGDDAIATTTPDEDGWVRFTVSEDKGYTVKERPVTGYNPTAIPTVYPFLEKGAIDLYSKENKAGGVFKFDDQIGQIPNVKNIMGSSFDAVAAINPKAEWVWDRPQSWSFGGNEIIFYHTTVDIPAGAKIDPAPFAFSCDNAAVLYVNGEAVAWSKAINGHVPAYGEGLSDLSVKVIDYDADPVSTVTYDIVNDLVPGQVNTIDFYAVNADVTNDSRYTEETMNPGLFIYAGKISYEVGLENDENVPFVNKKALPPTPPFTDATKNAVSSVTGTNMNPPKDYTVKNHMVYAVLDRAKLLAGEAITLNLYIGAKFDKLGEGQVRLVGDNLVFTYNGVGSFGLLVSDKANKLDQSDVKHNFSGGEGFITCPAGNGDIFFFVHFESFQYYAY